MDPHAAQLCNPGQGKVEPKVAPIAADLAAPGPRQMPAPPAKPGPHPMATAPPKAAPAAPTAPAEPDQASALAEPQADPDADYDAEETPVLQAPVLEAASVVVSVRQVVQ